MSFFARHRPVMCSMDLERGPKPYARRGQDAQTNCEDTVMNALKHLRTYLVLCSLVVAVLPLPGFAPLHSDASRTNLQQTLKERDGQHDFDFEIGTWKTHLSRLLHPLTGSTTWVE